MVEVWKGDLPDARSPRSVGSVAFKMGLRGGRRQRVEWPAMSKRQRVEWPAMSKRQRVEWPAMSKRQRVEWPAMSKRQRVEWPGSTRNRRRLIFIATLGRGQFRS
jgi:hypothetical protein